jgi:acyl dehydratase
MKDGALSHAKRVGLGLERVVHGEVAWEYLAPIRLNDELTTSTRIADRTTREDRRGETMTLVTLETTFTNQHQDLVAIRRDTLIELGAGA